MSDEVTQGTGREKPFPRRIFRKLVIVCGILLVVGIGTCRYVRRIPIPAYLPLSGDWVFVEKRTTRSWGLPCVYVRYEVPQPKADVIARLDTIISPLYEWKHRRELSSADIIEGLRRFYPEGEEIPHAELARRFAPSQGAEFAYSTKEPFSVLRWGRDEEPATNHSITVRTIPTGPSSCIVEIWDFRIFDH